MLGACCCAQVFSNCGEQGLLLVAVVGLLIVVASVAEHRLEGIQPSVVVAHRLTCPTACGIFLDQVSKLCPWHNPWITRELPLLLVNSVLFTQIHHEQDPRKASVCVCIYIYH